MGTPDEERAAFAFFKRHQDQTYSFVDCLRALFETLVPDVISGKVQREDPMPNKNSGFFVQSGHGATGNFEVVIPRVGGGIAHLWRSNDAPGFPWSPRGLAFGSTDDVIDVALIQSTLGPLGNLEAIVREGTKLVHHDRDDGGTWKWKVPTVLPGGLDIVGTPAFIQSSHGAIGNFEVVAPVAVGGMAHWWRNNNHVDLPWNGPTLFGIGNVEAVAMFQGNFGVAGNLEVIAQVGNQLVHYWRDDYASWAWHGPFPIATGAAGSHAFIQSSFGTVGNFELVAPAPGGGMNYWSRQNDTPGFPWQGPIPFGTGNATAVSLIQSSFGNLEVVARVGDQLAHYFLVPGGSWQGPIVFGAEPTVQPSVGGECTIPYKSGIVAVHSALLHTGNVLIFSFSDADANAGETRVLDPSNGTLQTPAHSHHLFCSGHSLMGEGELLVVGGHHLDVSSVHTFDPVAQAWMHKGSMANGRWYPTCTALGDGQVVAISGTKASGGPIGPTSPVNHTLQKYHPIAGIGAEQALPTPFSVHFPSSFPTIDLYPFVYLLTSNKLFVHSRNTTRFYDLPSQTWDSAQLKTQHLFSRTYPVEGTSVLLPLWPSSSPPYRPRVLIIGGGGADPESVTSTTPATKTCEILDLGDAAPAWRFTQPMQFARVMPDAVLLPDGSVVVVGGSSVGKADSGTTPVLAVERFDPVTETWSTMAPIRVPRLYHATALLLPDGSVFIGGKDGIFNEHPYKYPEHRVEIFKPPYFNSLRPMINTAPSTVTWATTFAIGTPQASQIGSVVLIRPGSVTHSFNMDQRLVGLAITTATASQVTVQMPAHGGFLPPGHYLLFIVDTNNVPSLGRFIKVG